MRVGAAGIKGKLVDVSSRSVISTAMLIACFAFFAAGIVVGVVTNSAYTPYLGFIGIFGMFVVTYFAWRSAGDSDYLRARQSDRTLDLASKTLPYMSAGLDVESSQAVCDLLLPAVAADAVAITDREKILGFSGIDKENHKTNSLIQSESTRMTLEDGATRVAETAKEVGFSHASGLLCAGVIAALTVNKHNVGTLKLYFQRKGRLTETQKAMAEGFAQLLSTQLSLSYLRQQTELAAKMELRALQAQINPHFLFNTINTITATVRMDPDKARVMLREFATYYRRLLENSEDLIPLYKEVEQTERYLMFQRERFGADQIEMEVSVEPGLEQLEVPSFILQPLVENSVGHGRREEGALHIEVKVYHASDSVVVSVADDGVGIPPERLETLVDGGSKTGMGIALKNVNARLKAYFGAISGLYIESKLGEGTTVYLSLYDALVDGRVKTKSHEDTASESHELGTPAPGLGEVGEASEPPELRELSELYELGA